MRQIRSSAAANILLGVSVVIGAFVVVVLTSVNALAADGKLTLASGDASTYKIRLCTDPILAERTAADELQKYLRQITGVTLPIQEAGPLPANAILVGRDAVCDSLVLDTPWTTLGEEGFGVTTAGSHLVLAGGRPRGTLYAVYSFLDQELGCRWFTADVSRIPKQNPLVISSSINRTFVPQFEYRDIYTPQCLTDWSPHNFLNGRYETRKYGGNVGYAGFYVHTFYLFLPPGQYFAEHPEWYSWRSEGTQGYGLGTEGIDYVREVSGGIQGERYYRNKVNGHPGQLCLTSPEVVAAVTEKVREWLLANPSAEIISISQNDNRDQRCQCVSCKASEEAEGPSGEPRPSGTLIRFVNQIAGNVQAEFPDVLVDTLAYHYTLDAPLHAKPRPNVIVRVCTGSCYLHPFVRPPDNTPGCGINAAFVASMAAWKTAWAPNPPRLYIWDYISGQALVPYPNLNVLEPNIKFFRDSGVKGVFAQSFGDDVQGAELTGLRSYILARLLWNPDYNRSNPNFARDEFVDFCYGPAAGPFKDYLALIEGKVPGFVWDPPHKWGYDWNSGSYLPPKVLSKAWELFDEAAALVAVGLPEFRKRLRTARMPIQYVVLKRGPEGGWWTADYVKGVGGRQGHWERNFHTPTLRETPVGSGLYVPWTNKELAEQFLAAAAEVGFPLGSFRDELIAQYGIDRKIIFLDAPAGTPDPILKGGTVQCTALAQYLLGKGNTPAVTYAWTAPEGRFEDTETTTSTLQNPRWVADIAIPYGDTSKEVPIQVTVSCGSESPQTRTYSQKVTLR